MSHGLQISASGMMSAMYRQDVFTNNLANMDTVGFKPDVPSFRYREAVTQEDGVGYLPSNELLERLGGGTMLNPNRVSFAQGNTRASGNALDLAIEGEGFFAVKKADEKGNEQTMLTRDGRFVRDPMGRLAMGSTGLPVLDANGNPIQLPLNGTVQIAGDGRVMSGGGEIAQLKFVNVADKSALRKEGNSLFKVSNDALGTATGGTGNIRQFAVEDSGVDEITALMQMQGASREVDANVALIQQHDKLMERAIAGLGRV